MRSAALYGSFLVSHAGISCKSEGISIGFSFFRLFQSIVFIRRIDCIFSGVFQFSCDYLLTFFYRCDKIIGVIIFTVGPVQDDGVVGLCVLAVFSAASQNIDHIGPADRLCKLKGYLVGGKLCDLHRIQGSAVGRITGSGLHKIGKLLTAVTEGVSAVYLEIEIAVISLFLPFF